MSRATHGRRNAVLTRLAVAAIVGAVTLAVTAACSDGDGPPATAGETPTTANQPPASPAATPAPDTPPEPPSWLLPPPTVDPAAPTPTIPPGVGAGQAILPSGQTVDIGVPAVPPPWVAPLGPPLTSTPTPAPFIPAIDPFVPPTPPPLVPAIAAPTPTPLPITIPPAPPPSVAISASSESMHVGDVVTLEAHPTNVGLPIFMLETEAGRLATAPYDGEAALEDGGPHGFDVVSVAVDGKQVVFELRALAEGSYRVRISASGEVWESYGAWAWSGAPSEWVEIEVLPE